MKLLDSITRLLPITRGRTQDLLNKAREDRAAHEPRRTNRQVDVFDANYRPGGLPYSVLRGYADVDPARLCINRVKSSLRRLDFAIVPVDEDNIDEAEIAAGEQWFSESGGIGRPGTLIKEFIDEVAEDIMVCGCVALYKRPTKARKAVGNQYPLASVEVIDAATIIPLRDSKGWIPEPPEAAFRQRLRTGAEKKFTTDELIYHVINSRSYSSYGRGYIEDCMMALLQFQAADIWNLQWFTEGDAVVGYWRYTGGGEVTPAEIETFRAWLRKVKTDNNERGKSPADLTPPAGWEYKSFRPRTEAEYIATQKFLFQRIVPYFGWNPSALGQESETYKASQQAQVEAATREAVRPLAEFFGDIFTGILQNDLGLTTVRFKFDLESIDLVRVGALLKQAGPAYVSPNEGRKMLGLPRIAGGLADSLFYMTQAGPVRIADTQEKLNAPTTDNAANEGCASSAGTPAEETGAEAQTTAQKEAREDLRRWRKKSRNAVRDGRSAAVRFVSVAIPAAVHAEIAKQLEAGGQPDMVFAPYIGADGQVSETWKEHLATGLDGLIEQLEQCEPM